MDVDCDYILKILLLGGCTGKSSLLRRYVEDKFDDSYYTGTIGIDFVSNYL